MYLITILFKSGNTLKIKATKFEVTRDGENVKKLVWRTPRADIFHIDITHIEAITSKKIWIWS